MSITLHWWIVPILLVVLAIAMHFKRSHGDYDFFTPLLPLPFYIAAICVTIGHYL